MQRVAVLSSFVRFGQYAKGTGEPAFGLDVVTPEVEMAGQEQAGQRGLALVAGIAVGPVRLGVGDDALVRSTEPVRGLGHRIQVGAGETIAGSEGVVRDVPLPCGERVTSPVQRLHVTSLPFAVGVDLGGCATPATITEFVSPFSPHAAMSVTQILVRHSHRTEHSIESLR